MQEENKRQTARVVPGRPVFVAMEGSRGPVGRGLVSNISSGGACLALAGAFDVGDDVILRLSFFQQATPVAATARVVWAGAAPRGGTRFGVTWTHAGPQRLRLESMIRTTA